MAPAATTPGHAAPSAGRTLALTALTMCAFAANSVLCRLALRGGAIDPAAYTAVRLLSGAAALAAISLATRTPLRGVSLSWLPAFLLFVYAVAFSFAYVTLSIGTGALILFGAVQATMILAGIAGGERPGPGEWLGLAIALGGLAYLVSPGLTAPSPIGAALMAIAGVAWGFYSLRGRGAGSPLARTTLNFLRAAPLAAAVWFLQEVHSDYVTPRGLLLAAASGALASGCGYVVWYAALRGLSATRAATVQLSVPVLAAAAGVLFLGEAVSLRLVVSSVLILGGIALVLAAHARAPIQTDIGSELE